jgi:hypothetical protein
MQRLFNFLSSLFGDRRLPKSFRNSIEKHKDKIITAMEVCRTPLEGVAKTFANIVSLGKFDEIAKEQGPDGFFHLYSILTLDDGTQLLLEKNEVPVLSTSLPNKKSTTECEMVSIDKQIPLGEFIAKTVKRMTLETYNRYNALSYNCQNFLLNHLQANGLITPQLKSFIMQDLDKLIEETPSFSKYLTEKITDLAGKGKELLEELVYRKGGVFNRNNRNNRYRRLHKRM